MLGKHSVHRPRVKICCISSLDEAELAIAHGASALGLVSAMPSGPGVIDETLIARIAAEVPPPIATFLLTSLTEASDIVDQHRRCGTTTLQLCDYVDLSVYEVLRQSLPGIGIVQVVHVTGSESLELATSVAPLVDALLLDSGNTQLAVKQLGGTGRTHDWQVSQQIRKAVEVPLFLAGGLKPGNVAEAFRSVGPFGLDVCSGVRTDGRLDAEKLRELFAAI
ncbi:phosphoribosylanthranilate isomerase [Aeoliella mucimassa]|uniref:N-(5'-phosphoribosyl)anthranilate isomerase n=1 Tax=Aeoliella mucimassa TaxID=2527972 RepID=A0A518AJ84_9BACT|nr:phosphoribosylanthranilate isomerase [Aeoliella mucimassa]QDU54766.1 N-(5'-phosphoribosyl)anthranilate isomerase [Aeoliella mucimassa]